MNKSNKQTIKKGGAKILQKQNEREFAEYIFKKKRRKQSAFDPDQIFLDQAKKKFFKNGGEVTRDEPVDFFHTDSFDENMNDLEPGGTYYGG